MKKIRIVVILNMLLALATACDAATNSGLADIGSIETPDVVTIVAVERNEVSGEIVEPSIGDATKTPAMIIMTSEHATSTVTSTNTVTIVPDTVEATIVPLSTNTLDAVDITSQDTDQSGLENAEEIELGIGGLVADLEGWAEKEIEQFYTVSHIDINTLQFVSKYRSRAGHDYSGTFEGCSSNKHYFHPLNFYEVALTTPIYSASDGVFLYIQKETGNYAMDWQKNYEEVTGKTWPEDLQEYQLFFRPDAAPNLWIRYHHVTPIEEMSNHVVIVEGTNMMMHREKPKLPGYRVDAGDLIAHGLGEISIEQHLDGPGIPSPCTSEHVRSTRGYLPGCTSTTRFLSIFDYMTDEVFAQYRELADVERSDFKISKEELAKNSYTCTGEFFDNKGNTPDADTYILLQGTRGGSKSNVIQGDIESAKDLGEIITSFEGNGNGQYGPFVGSAGDVIMVTSDAGPLALVFSKEDDSRIIYNRPEGSGSIVYETVTPFGGQVSVGVTTLSGVSWEVVVFRID